MRWFALLFLPFALPSVAHAVDGLALTLGRADKNGAREPLENTQLMRVTAIWDRYSGVPLGDHWHEESYWEFDVGYWRWSNHVEEGELWEVAATPVFRLERGAAERGLWPFVEGGIGPHLISETRVSGRNLSTNFHFGSHLGAGVRFGSRKRHELMFRAQHLSNAGIETPNPGINFFLLRWGYRFR